MLFTLLFPFFRTPQTASDCVSFNHPPQTPPGQWALKDSLKSDQLFHILLAIEAYYFLETVLDPILSLLDQSYFVSIIGEWSPKLFTKVAWTIYIDRGNLRSGFLQLQFYASFTSVIFMHTTAFKKGCQITGCLELMPYEKWTMASEDVDMRPDRRAISEDDITAMTTFPFPGGGMRVLSSVLVGPPRFPLVYHYF